MELIQIRRPEEWDYLEGNDCTVMTVSTIASLPYLEARAIMKAAGRRPKKGATLSECAKVFSELGGKVTYLNEKRALDIAEVRIAGHVDIPDGATRKQMTLEKFVAENPVGRFVLLITGHATTLIDGKIYDNHLPKAGKKVEMALAFS